MNEFTTVTDTAAAEKERLKQALVIGLFMTICNFLSLTVSFSLFLMIEVVICAVTFLCVQLPKRNQDWTLHFEDDELHVKNNTTGETYQIYAIPTTDFRFRQSKKDRAADRGSLTVRHTIFAFPCVKNISAMRAYIQQYFSKYDVA